MGRSSGGIGRFKDEDACESISCCGGGVGGDFGGRAGEACVRTKDAKVTLDGEKGEVGVMFCERLRERSLSGWGVVLEDNSD